MDEEVLNVLLGSVPTEFGKLLNLNTLHLERNSLRGK